MDPKSAINYRPNIRAVSVGENRVEELPFSSLCSSEHYSKDVVWTLVPSKKE